MIQLLARLLGRKASTPAPVLELTDAQLTALYSLEPDGADMVSLTAVLKRVFGINRQKNHFGFYLENCTGVRKRFASDVHGYRIHRSDVVPFFEAAFARDARLEAQVRRASFLTH